MSESPERAGASTMDVRTTAVVTPVRVQVRADAPLVLATHNHGKVAELRTLCSARQIPTISAIELGLPVPAEPFDRYKDNALAKARAASRVTQRPAIACDTGLEFDALDGQPGVHTKEYGEAAGGWIAARRSLHQALTHATARARREGLPDPGRGATLVCALALCDGETVVTAEHRVRGHWVWPDDQPGEGLVAMFVPDAGEIVCEGVMTHRRGAFEQLLRECAFDTPNVVAPARA